MTVALQALAWLNVCLSFAVIIASLVSVIRNPRGPKYYLRIYDAAAGVYILIMYLLLAFGVLIVGDWAALIARLGFSALLGLFIAELIAEMGPKWMQRS